MSRKATCIAALFMLAACASPAAGAEVLGLDSYSPVSGHLPTVTTAVPLGEGRSYVVEVSGTVSHFEPHLWENPSPPFRLCGVPEAAPETPSPGRPASRAGNDAENIFSVPWRYGACPKLPIKWTNFRMDLGQGAGFVHYEPFEEEGHRFLYHVTGGGVPAAFRLIDSNTKDNTGVLTIRIRLPTSVECAQLSCAAGDAPPTAAMFAHRAIGPHPLPTIFVAEASWDDDAIESWALDFGDGTRVSGSGTPGRVEHVYRGTGTYQATLRVTDTVGQSATSVTSLVVYPAVSSLVPDPFVEPLAETGVAPRFAATLKRSHDLVAMEGHTVTFRAGSRLLCTSVTDAQGRAGCDAAADTVPDVVSRLGYTAFVAGDADHTSATAEAALVRVAGVDIG